MPDCITLRAGCHRGTPRTLARPLHAWRRNALLPGPCRFWRCRPASPPSITASCAPTTLRPKPQRHTPHTTLAQLRRSTSHHFCSAAANCLPSAWGMGVSCTLRDLANLPNPCPIAQPWHTASYDTQTRASRLKAASYTSHVTLCEACGWLPRGHAAGCVVVVGPPLARVVNLPAARRLGWAVESSRGGQEGGQESGQKGEPRPEQVAWARSAPCVTARQKASQALQHASAACLAWSRS